MQKKRGLRERADFHDFRPEVRADGLVVTGSKINSVVRGVVWCPRGEEKTASALMLMLMTIG